MQITKLPGSKVKFEVIIPVETFQESIEEAFKKKNQEVEIKGFRKGQAPKEVYIANYGIESLYEEALQLSINYTYFNAVTENKIDACAYPQIDLDQEKFNPNEPIHYEVTVSVYPEVELGQYTGLEIKKEKVSVSAKEVNEKVNADLEKEAMMVVKEGEDAVIVKGDTAVFDFEGFKDGVAFEGGSSKDFSLEIGSGRFIPGFEDQMIGMKAGEKKDLNVKFPDDYQAEDLKGAEVVFKVEVKSIKQKSLPELNDEFVAGLKIEGVSTVDEYKKNIKKEIKEHKEHHANEHAEADLLNQIVQASKLELAEDFIDEQVEREMEYHKREAKQYNIPFENFIQYYGYENVDAYKAQIRVGCETSMAQNFVLKAIAEKEGMVPSKEEIDQRVQEIAKQYHVSIEQVKQSIPESSVIDDINAKKAIEFIHKNNKFVTE